MAISPNYIFHSQGLWNFVNYAEYSEIFSPPECESIIQMGLATEAKDGGITEANITDHEYRKSRISWIECTYENGWMWHKLADIANKANDAHYCFKLLGFKECCQFTTYDTEGSHYDWHMDFGNGRMSQRKLSITVQLSKPESYDGGDLELFYGAKPAKAARGLGTATVFPSYTMHRVTPIVSGVRYSLVVWVSAHEPYR
jgi:PKHD-type hydroxylase